MTYLSITRSQKAKTFLQHHRDMDGVRVTLSAEASQFLRRKYKETSCTKRRQKTRRHFVFSYFMKRLTSKICGFKRAYFQNGGSQNAARGSSRKTERGVQSLETQSPQGLLLNRSSFNCSIVSSRNMLNVHVPMNSHSLYA